MIACGRQMLSTELNIPLKQLFSLKQNTDRLDQTWLSLINITAFPSLNPSGQTELNNKYPVRFSTSRMSLQHETK